MTSKTQAELARPTQAPALYAQDGQGYGATVYAHYFVGSCDWLVTEYDPADDLAFGWAMLGGDRQNAELGYVSFAELDELRMPLYAQAGDDRVLLGHTVVELDTGWPDGLTLTQAVELLDSRQGR